MAPRSRRRRALARAEDIEYDRIVSIPVAVRNPVLAKYLWVLVLFGNLLIRRLEPPRSTRAPPKATTPPRRGNRWGRGSEVPLTPPTWPRSHPVAAATSGRGARRRRTGAG